MLGHLTGVESPSIWAARLRPSPRPLAVTFQAGLCISDADKLQDHTTTATANPTYTFLSLGGGSAPNPKPETKLPASFQSQEWVVGPGREGFPLWGLPQVQVPKTSLPL